MTRQHCHECGTDVPVDDVTGLCHVGHRVNSPSLDAPTTTAGGADAPDEPAPWVATVDDDDVEPRREADPTAPPPPATALGSATAPPPGAGFDPDVAGRAPMETPDLDAPVSAFAAEAPEAQQIITDVTGGDDPSLEDLAAMASMAPDADLASLGDDLRADLTPAAPAMSAPTSPDVDEFDLDSLEQAVADLGGDASPAAPAATAPAPDPTPAPEPTSNPTPMTADDPPAIDDVAAATDEVTGADDAPVTIRPDHEPAASGGAGGGMLDPTNFTASGRRVSAPAGDDAGLVGKLKGLFGR